MPLRTSHEFPALLPLPVWLQHLPRLPSLPVRQVPGPKQFLPAGNQTGLCPAQGHVPTLELQETSGHATRVSTEYDTVQGEAERGAKNESG